MKKFEYEKIILDPDEPKKGQRFFCGRGLVTLKASINNGKSLELIEVRKGHSYPFLMSNGSDYSLLYPSREEKLNSKASKMVSTEKKEDPYAIISQLRKELAEEIAKNKGKDFINNLLGGDPILISSMEILSPFEKQEYKFTCAYFKDLICLDSDTLSIKISLDGEKTSFDRTSLIAVYNLPLKGLEISLIEHPENGLLSISISSIKEFFDIKLKVQNDIDLEVQR